MTKTALNKDAARRQAVVKPGDVVKPAAKLKEPKQHNQGVRAVAKYGSSMPGAQVKS